ncbi:MAG: hypothetical protein JRI23_28745, partial [Deltaproteobacteria bacterium]|nr:hypothetical protein [Deltaproteobacteria bacterium]MBW2536102.1 hypothetical protein [Deltaproteobacteria bacterium]
MARSDEALRLRVPAQARRRSAEREAAERGSSDRPRLRLVVTRGRLGVELEEPFAIGPVRVAELALSLPDVKFPVELTGGITAFRNRRGQLERVRVELGGDEVSRWARVQLGRVTDDAEARLVAAAVEDGWLLGLTWGRSALAFEVVVAPLDGDLRLLPTLARGVGLSVPPQTMAIRALGALLRPVGKLAGGAVLIEDAAGEIGRAVLPLCGMRAPAAGGVRWESPQSSLRHVALFAEQDAPPAELSERVVREVELAALVGQAEQRLLSGELDEARRLYLAALERAPRHPELSRRVAEVDACVGGRAEAALGLLSEATLAVDAGLLGARLLQEVGDREGALTAYRRAAEQEPFGPLAAMAWLELAALLPDVAERMDALDRAVSRSAALDLARWRRFEERVKSGDLRGMQEDASHLEAQARGSFARHDVARRVAARLLGQGLVEQAAAWYERALRYLPDSVDAVAGLARALQSVGRPRRALDLLGRAAGLAARADRSAHAVVIDLAKALVEVADDRPAAIAHVSRIPPFTGETFEARLLEARWRAELGDLAGADVALGRLAEAVEHAQAVLLQEPTQSPTGFGPLWGEQGVWTSPLDARAAVARLLAEGAEIQRLDRQDRPAARRLAELAMRLRPQDGRLRAAYRQLCAELQRQDGPRHEPQPTAPPRSASGAEPTSEPPAGALTPPPPAA